MGLINRDLINKCGEHLGGDASLSTCCGSSLVGTCVGIWLRGLSLRVSGAPAESASVWDTCALLIPWPFPLGSGIQPFSRPSISAGSSPSENLGTGVLWSQSTGGRLHRPNLPTPALTSCRPPRSCVRAREPGLPASQRCPVCPLPLRSPGTQASLRGDGAARWPDKKIHGGTMESQCQAGLPGPKKGPHGREQEEAGIHGAEELGAGLLPALWLPHHTSSLLRPKPGPQPLGTY